jgi:hypothetical protein
VFNHNFKVSPSARCIPAANAICKETDIFNKDKISLIDISLLYLFLHFLDFALFFCSLLLLAEVLEILVVVLVVAFVVVVVSPDFVMCFNSHFMYYICAVFVLGPVAVDAAHKINN